MYLPLQSTARCVQKGDKVIIMAYCNMMADEAKEHRPTVVFVDDNNKVSQIMQYEKHGEIK